MGRVRNKGINRKPPPSRSRRWLRSSVGGAAPASRIVRCRDGQRDFYKCRNSAPRAGAIDPNLGSGQTRRSPHGARRERSAHPARRALAPIPSTMPSKMPSLSTVLVAAFAAASAVPILAQRKPLAAFGVQILAFGDSITQGCTNVSVAGCGGDEMFPYAAFTHETLQQARPGMANVSSVGHWNLYSTEMAQSLRQELAERKPDVVLIMAGGNDMLRWFKANIPKGKQNFSEPDENTTELLTRQAEEMVSNIQALHKAAHDVLPNVKTIAVGYPMVELVWKLGDGAVDTWEGLSKRIEYDGGADAFIDFNDILAYDEIEENKYQAEDKVHFTKAGFKQMGVRMAEKLTDVLTNMAGAVQLLQENGVGGINGNYYFEKWREKVTY